MRRTIGSRGEVPVERKPVRRNDNDDDDDDKTIITIKLF